MHNHEPAGYDCPFCDFPPEREPEVVYRDETVFAMIAPRWWPRNPGHLLIIPGPTMRTSTTCRLPWGTRSSTLLRCSRGVMRTAYDCAGVSTRYPRSVTPEPYRSARPAAPVRCLRAGTLRACPRGSVAPSP